jgi:hypothetical protein
MKPFRMILPLVLILTITFQAEAKSRRSQIKSSWGQASSAKLTFAEKVQSPGIGVADEDEDRRYEAAKAKAKADPTVQKLRAEALRDFEGRQASIRYNEVLYGKIGEIDSSVRERAALVGQAILNRLKE